MLECYRPTFDNVAREFIHEALISSEIDEHGINFRTVFIESEAKEYAEKMLDELLDCDSKSLEAYRNSISKQDSSKPLLIIKNYRMFFNLLADYYANMINLYDRKYKKMAYDHSELFTNVHKFLWLRATAYDLINPEIFLERNVTFSQDQTFHPFDNEAYMGKISSFPDCVITAQNCVAYTWDETPIGFHINIYPDKVYYNTRPNAYKFPYKLPIVRYGIYKENNQKACYIGAIQRDRILRDLKSINRYMYKLNKGVTEAQAKETDKSCFYRYMDNIDDVSVSSVLSLSTFINFLHQEGITDIMLPTSYPLQHHFHEIQESDAKKEFENKWSEWRIERNPNLYKEQLERLNKVIGKVDIIEENMTKKFIRTFMRMAYYYPHFEILQYPSNDYPYLKLRIPKVHSCTEINNELLQDMYNLVDNTYQKQIKAKIC